MSNVKTHSSVVNQVEDALMADQFFRAGYRPADDATTNYTQDFAVKLVGRRAETPANRDKYFACICDYLAMVQKSSTGLVAWQMEANNYTGAKYSRSIAERVRDQLVHKGILQVIQEHQQGTCRIYEDKGLESVAQLSFLKSYSTGVLKVREASSFEEGRRRRGKLIPLRKFKTSQTEPLIKQMEDINRLMDKYPLVSPEGTVWSDCYRQFNDGDPTGSKWVNRGGRVYGSWQSKQEQDRLQCSIGGQEICEIDIKACYLFIANQFSSQEILLPDDPYQLINFVKRDQSLRLLAKILTSSILSKDGPVTRFPKGKKLPQGQGYQSLRTQFNLRQSVKCTSLIGDIMKAFPFLNTNQKKGLELMFLESEVIVRAMSDLVDQSVPTYPVHDCLLCRLEDEKIVTKIIQDKMMDMFNSYATLEVGYKDKESKIIPSSHPLSSTKSSTINEDKEMVSYDCDVIEKF